MLKENIGEFKSYALRRAGEILLSKTPNNPLIINPNANVETAKELNQEGRWLDAGMDYYSVAMSDGTERTIPALIEASQMFINTQQFANAGVCLQEVKTRISLVTDPRKANLIKARVDVQKGWIADNTADYKLAIDHFSSARKHLDTVDSQDRTADENSTYSTATHFLGRGYEGLAWIGIDPLRNAIEAKRYFEEDLAYFMHLKEMGDDRPANIGFQHQHIALNLMRIAREHRSFGYSRGYKDNIAEARRSITLACKAFKSHKETHAESSIMAHAELIKGILHYFTGEYTVAEQAFQTAVNIREEGIRTGVERYDRGFVDASVGLAISQVKRRKIREAISTLKRAKDISLPFTALRLMYGF